MNPAGFSIRQPVTVLMAMLAVLVLGIVGFTQLKVALIPDIDFPMVIVLTRYPGTPPEEVEEFVTKPVEEQAAVVENLESVSSMSQEDLSVVMIEFEWGQDMDWASFNAREKIDPVIEQLPDGAHRPTIMKLDPSTLQAVMTINVTGMEDQQRLREIADDEIKPELEKLPGVASADIYGGLQREIRVEVDRERLNAYRLSVQQIENALRAENLNVPLGFTTEGRQEYTLRLVGQFESVEEIPNIAVANRNGRAIRLRDVAVVSDTHQEVRSYARVNGEPCVTLSITKESDANTVEVSHAVHEALTELPEKLPPGISTTVTADQAEFIEDALHNLYGVGIEGAVLAVVIIFFFLATITGTLVAAISIPLSILAVFVLMYFGDMTLNIVTMGGLILAIGRIVDDSVVVLENIYRHTENGEPPVDAAISGTAELAMAITAVTLATMCVFVPLVFVGGMITQLFTSMALVVMFGLLASLVVALTAVPMMSARLLHYHTASEGKDRSG
ncbi:MAG: efflux RND transporter permease subunit, partial [Armatimonadota bacterium]